MMHVPPSEAQRLSLHDYQALLHGWEQAHKTEDEATEPPSVEENERRRELLEARGIKVLH